MVCVKMHIKNKNYFAKPALLDHCKRTFSTLICTSIHFCHEIYNSSAILIMFHILIHQDEQHNANSCLFCGYSWSINLCRNKLT